MLMTVNIQTFLPEAATATWALPCRHAVVVDSSRLGFVRALAVRCDR
jgi:hypothetical protein